MKTRNPDSVFDELLVMQYKTGDTKALDLLIKRWHKKLVVYAYRNTRSMEASKDIAQDVWMVAIKNILQLKDHAKIGSWLLSITHNKSMDWIRKVQKERLENEKVDIQQTEEQIDNRDQISIMRKAMTELSSEHQIILSLFYLEGFSLTEIESILNITKGTIKSRLFYARESLKNKLKNIIL